MYDRFSFWSSILRGKNKFWSLKYILLFLFFWSSMVDLFICCESMIIEIDFFLEKKTTFSNNNNKIILDIYVQ